MIKFTIVQDGDSTRDTLSIKHIEAENKHEALTKAQEYIDEHGKHPEIYYLVEYIGALVTPPIEELVFEMYGSHD